MVCERKDQHPRRCPWQTATQWKTVSRAATNKTALPFLARSDLLLCSSLRAGTIRLLLISDGAL